MENLRGAAFMVLAMFSFALLDTTIKILSQSMSVGQALALISIGILALLLGWSVVQGIPLWQAEYRNSRVILRSLCDGCRRHASSSIVLRNVPIPSAATSTTSPGLR